MSFTAKPKIFVCPDTGLLVVIGLTNMPTSAAGQFACFVSVDGGVNWTPPAWYTANSIACFAVASGRIFLNAGAVLMATDNIAGG
jgi:hypothetical protein